MPDERLLQLSSDGLLSNAAVLRVEVERMLRDDRSIQLSRQFVTQWLGLNGVGSVAIDPEYYPVQKPWW